MIRTIWPYMEAHGVEPASPISNKHNDCNQWVATTAIAGVYFYYHLNRPEFFATEGRLNAC